MSLMFPAADFAFELFAWDRAHAALSSAPAFKTSRDSVFPPKGLFIRLQIVCKHGEEVVKKWRDILAHSLPRHKTQLNGSKKAMKPMFKCKGEWGVKLQKQGKKLPRWKTCCTDPLLTGGGPESWPGNKNLMWREGRPTPQKKPKGTLCFFIKVDVYECCHP